MPAVSWLKSRPVKNKSDDVIATTVLGQVGMLLYDFFF